MEKTLRIVVILLVVVLALSPIPALAVANPDAISVTTSKVFTNIFDTDDWLIYVQYDIEYAAPPSEEPDDTFLIALFNTSDELVLSREVHWYQENLCSMYITAAQATSLSLTWGTETYYVRVMGNPTYFTLVEDTNMDTWVLSASHWRSGVQSVSRGYLQTQILATADDMEDAGIETMTGELINATGRDYFEWGVPGITNACPDAFTGAVEYASVTEPTFTQAGQTTMSANVGARLQNALDNLGTYVGVPGVVVGGVGIFLLYFILAGRVYVATGSVHIALAMGIPLILAGTYIGVITLEITLLIAAVLVVLFAITFLYQRFA